MPRSDERSSASTADRPRPLNGHFANGFTVEHAMKIALIRCSNDEYYTSHDLPNEDALLRNFLRERGHLVEQPVWNDPHVDWKQYDIAILKSPWDYHDRLEQFQRWLDMMESLDVRLLNPANSVRWNLNKRYLQDIADHGLPVVATEYLERGAHDTIQKYFEHFDTDTLVLKPCVSASAKNTMVLHKNTLSENEIRIHKFLREDDYLLQPFVEEIREGEWSLLFFGGRFSHGLLKVPKNGDFRVQHFFGGAVIPQTPSSSLIEKAFRYVEQFAQGTLYARVDGVIRSGEFYLMELEIIEPYLYLETHPGSYENYYTALNALML